MSIGHCGGESLSEDMFHKEEPVLGAEQHGLGQGMFGRWRDPLFGSTCLESFGEQPPNK